MVSLENKFIPEPTLIIKMKELLIIIISFIASKMFIFLLRTIDFRHKKIMIYRGIQIIKGKQGSKIHFLNFYFLSRLLFSFFLLVIES